MNFLFKLVPGERLPTAQPMIATFGVSRTVVREAIAGSRAYGRRVAGEHRAIGDAIDRGGAEAACRAMRAHLTRARDRSRKRDDQPGD